MVCILPSDNLSLHSLHALVKNSLLSAFIPILQHQTAQLQFLSNDFISENRYFCSERRKQSRLQAIYKVYTTIASLC